MMVVAAILASCSEQYSVQGSSSISSLDGSKLYLKAVKNKELTNIDSCEVVHGQFHFSGTLDTVRMASLFMDDRSLMPIVLEQGDIRIGTFGPATAKSVADNGLRLDMEAPTKEHPSMTGALNAYLKKQR